MQNLKKETMEAIEESCHTIADIDYCDIKEEYEYGKYNILSFSNIDIDKLNIMYDDGYGAQNIFGFIVFKDSTWLERGEYDGSEWWEYKKKPILKDNK